MSLEIVMGEVTEEFGGEDPLKPVLRTVLEKSRKSWSSCMQQSSLSGGSLCCPNPLRKGSNSRGNPRTAGLRPRSLQNLTTIEGDTKAS
jgi:hypothetical protein